MRTHINYPIHILRNVIILVFKHLNTFYGHGCYRGFFIKRFPTKPTYNGRLQKAYRIKRMSHAPRIDDASLLDPSATLYSADSAAIFKRLQNLQKEQNKCVSVFYGSADSNTHI